MSWDCPDDRKWNIFVCHIEKCQSDPIDPEDSDGLITMGPFGYIGISAKAGEQEDMGVINKDDNTCSWEIPYLECDDGTYSGNEYYVSVERGGICGVFRFLTFGIVQCPSAEVVSVPWIGIILFFPRSSLEPISFCIVFRPRRMSLR